MRSSRPSASKPHNNTAQREQNPHYGHYNGLSLRGEAFVGPRQEAEVSAYFTPQEWWNLGPVGIVTELQQVYKNFIRALDAWM